MGEVGRGDCTTQPSHCKLKRMVCAAVASTCCEQFQNEPFTWAPQGLAAKWQELGMEGRERVISSCVAWSDSLYQPGSQQQADLPLVFLQEDKVGGPQGCWGSKAATVGVDLTLRRARRERAVS